MTRAVERQYPVSTLIVFCFIRRGGEVLLVERALPPYQGMRTIPGGHKAHGEELLAACLREMKEETGLVLHDCRFAGHMQVHPHGRTSGPEFLCIYYVADEFSGEVTPGEEGFLTWTKMDDALKDTGTHPALRALLPSIQNDALPFMAEAYVDGDGKGEYVVTGPGKGAKPSVNRVE